MNPHRRDVSQLRSGSRNSRTAATFIGIVMAMTVLMATGGGVWWWAQHRVATNNHDFLLYTVERDDFELTVTERGEVESFDVTEVRSLVKSNNSNGMSILRIVPEGTKVVEGDFLVELDSSALDSERTTQQISFNTTKASVVEASNLYETAVISKREYLEGTFVQERQTIEGLVFVAEENLNRAREYYAFSKRLASKGYVNDLQLEADRFAVEKAQKELDAAKTQLMVLDEFTKAKMLMQLESDIRIAEAKWEAAKKSFELEMGKLEDIEDQIRKCMIFAPQAGVVKYAHETDRRGDQEFIVEEGAVIRERQVIVNLPNAGAMRVELKINESLVQYIQSGLLASINPVGLGDRTFRGSVQKVNQYAEPSGWRRANVKEYRAYVSVDDAGEDLRSGMTASVTIHCSRVRDALQVPVQSVYMHGSNFYCFVYDGSWEASEITPGPTNDKYFVVEGGLEEGQRIALNPRRFVDQVELPELPPEEKQRAVPQDSPELADGEQGAGTVGITPPGGQQPGLAGQPSSGQQAALGQEPTSNQRPAFTRPPAFEQQPGGERSNSGQQPPATGTVAQADVAAMPKQSTQAEGSSQGEGG